MTDQKRKCLVLAITASWGLLLLGCEDKKTGAQPSKEPVLDSKGESSTQSPTAPSERDRKSEPSRDQVLDSERGIETESGARGDSPETR